MKARTTKRTALSRRGRSLESLQSRRQITSAKRSRQTRSASGKSGGATLAIIASAEPAVVDGTAVPVHFELTAPTAQEVYIAGTFNDWQMSRMTNLGDGRWIKDLSLPFGTYEYRFVVDSRWIPDPGHAHTAPNPFGEANSVLVVGPKT